MPLHVLATQNKGLHTRQLYTCMHAHSTDYTHICCTLFTTISHAPFFPAGGQIFIPLLKLGTYLPFKNQLLQRKITLFSEYFVFHNRLSLEDFLEWNLKSYKKSTSWLCQPRKLWGDKNVPNTLQQNNPSWKSPERGKQPTIKNRSEHFYQIGHTKRWQKRRPKWSTNLPQNPFIQKLAIWRAQGVTEEFYAVLLFLIKAFCNKIKQV